jgi:hypothetical protein
MPRDTYNALAVHLAEIKQETAFRAWLRAAQQLRDRTHETA